jgi:hypothetical protein
MTTKKAALVGFVIGVVLSAAYVALGGNAVPKLASIIFFPGVSVAWWLALFLPEHWHAGLRVYTCATVGCIVVGFTYAGIFTAAALVINRLRYRSRTR